MSIEILERAADSGARLLRVEALSAVAEGVFPALLLTFDLGRVVVAVDEKSGGLSLFHIENAEDVPDGRSDLAEEEPWWRLIGSPLFGVRRLASAEEPNGLRLQFRADTDKPHFVRLAPRGAALLSRLETAERTT